MTLTAFGHLGGDPEQYCEQLVIESADWHEATDLAELNRALSRPMSLRELVRLARELNQKYEGAPVSR